MTSLIYDTAFRDKCRNDRSAPTEGNAAENLGQERFRSLSTDAKMLYGILLDRMSLSLKNGWLDDQGRGYIIFTIHEVMAHMGCANKKAISLLAELEKKAGLIVRKRQGLGRPNLIYVKHFVPKTDVS